MKANIYLSTAEPVYMSYSKEMLACGYHNLFKKSIVMNALKTLLSD